MKGIRSSLHRIGPYEGARAVVMLPPKVRSPETPGKDSKKSELFGFGYYPYRYGYGYPYRGYGYGYPYRGYGYGYGYPRYGYGGYPYYWSNWWYSNGYGEQDGPGVKILIVRLRYEQAQRLATPGIVTKEEAELAAKWLAEDEIDIYDIISGKDKESKFQTWWYGMQVEAAAHGSTGGSETNVTGDDLETTAKIVLAHLKERNDYYHRLFDRVHRSKGEEGRTPGAPPRPSVPAPRSFEDLRSGMKGLPVRRWAHGAPIYFAGPVHHPPPPPYQGYV